VSHSLGPEPPTPELAQWMEAARRGSVQALGALLEHFRRYLLLVANRRLGDDLRTKVGPSDLVQETLLRAQHHFGRFHGQTDQELRRWLRRILLNRMANVDRQYRGTAKRRLARELPLAGGSVAELRESLAAPAATPGTAAIAQEQDAALRQALEHLPEHYRQVVVWRNFEGLSFGEIGQRLSRSADAVRMIWTRALEQLGQALGPCDDFR
jgi:RNA polymerase sigma-70 factor (ECF subfamily)